MQLPSRQDHNTDLILLSFRNSWVGCKRSYGFRYYILWLVSSDYILPHPRPSVSSISALAPSDTEVLVSLRKSNLGEACGWVDPASSFPRSENRNWMDWTWGRFGFGISLFALSFLSLALFLALSVYTFRAKIEQTQTEYAEASAAACTWF